LFINYYNLVIDNLSNYPRSRKSHTSYLKKNIRHHHNMALIKIRSATRHEKVFCYFNQIVDLISPTTSTYLQHILYMCVCVWSVNKSYPYLTLGLYKRFIYIDGLPKDRWTGPNWCVHTTHIYHLFLSTRRFWFNFFSHNFFYLLLCPLYGPHLLLSIQTDFFDVFVLYLNPSQRIYYIEHLHLPMWKKNPSHVTFV